MIRISFHQQINHTDNMQTILVLSVLVAVALSMPQNLVVPVSPNIRSLPPAHRFEARDGYDQFSESFDTYDGQHHEETGQLNLRDDGQDYVLEKKGSYQYISPEGIPFKVSWVADRQGFRPSGEHLAIPVV